MGLIRLQKFLSEAGVCSRRRGETYIREGHVTVNGVVVRELGTKVDPDTDAVTFQGRILALEKRPVYIALNKPPGYVTSCHHSGEAIVLDLVDFPQRVYPVGRLDKDSTGLLLLTNDGRLHHHLSHPSFDHEKEYVVTVAAPISPGALKRMADGMPVLGSKTRPAEIRRLTATTFRIVLREGRNRQIRRMVRKVGNQVVRLERIRIANIRLGGLKQGRWRPLTEAELAGLLKGLEKMV